MDKWYSTFTKDRKILQNLYENKGELHDFDSNEILKTDSDIVKLSDI